MTVGERIKATRTTRGMTQKQVGEKCGMADSAIRAYELGRANPKYETLQRIAGALGVSVDYLLAAEKKPGPFWSADLQEKLNHVGFSIGVYEEDAYLWINYPDGTLEVTEEELKELNDSADSYLRFKLIELRDRHKDRFRPK